MGPKPGKKQVKQSKYALQKDIISICGGKDWLAFGGKKERIPPMWMWMEPYDPKHIAFLFFLSAKHMDPEGRHAPISDRRVYYWGLTQTQRKYIFMALGCPFESTERTRFRVGSTEWYDLMLKLGMWPDSDDIPFPRNDLNEVFSSELLKRCIKIDEYHGFHDKGTAYWFKKLMAQSESNPVVLPPPGTVFPSLDVPPSSAYNPFLEADDPTGQWVYFFVTRNAGKFDWGPNGLIKIGISKEPDKRLKAGQRFNPSLRIYGMIPGTFATEKYIHRLCEDHRITCEDDSCTAKECFMSQPVKEIVDRVLGSFPGNKHA